MLSELLGRDKIKVIESVANWEEGIKKASFPLLKKEYISEDYVKAMIQDIKEFGPYMIIAPGIALPHSRPEHGVNKLGMSLLKINEGVLFPTNESVHLIIVLAAVDNNSHLDALSKLAKILMEEDKREGLLKANNVEELEYLLKQ